MSNYSPSLQPKIDQAHILVKYHYPAFIRDLQELVSMDRGSHYKQGLDAAINWMEARTLALACETEIIRDETYGNVLVARFKGKGKGRFLIFGHMDTVWPEGTAAQWPMEINGNIATGPGVVDNTAGSLAGLYCLMILKEMGFDRFEEVVFVNNCDEEIGSPFSRQIFLNVAKDMDYAICLESSSFADEIIGERAGKGRFYVTVNGKGAHTGVSPEDGVDAGLELCHKILAMKQVKGEDHVLHTSVVKINAGKSENSVCEYAEALIHVRVKTWKEYERVCKLFDEIVNTSYVPGSTATMKTYIGHGPMERLPGSDVLSATIVDVANSIGLTLRDVWCGGAADSCFTAEAGVPTMCGVGPLGQKYHTREELLDISTIVPRVTTLIGTIIAMTEKTN